MNYCTSCKKDFTSLEFFDSHRVGKHEYTYSQGIAMEPMREDGRRCLYTFELKEAGWKLNKAGRWFTPSRSFRGVRMRSPSGERVL